MAPSTTCGVCGTVNVIATGRCIACSQPLADLGPPPARAPAPAGGGASSKTAPLEEDDYRAAEALAAQVASSAPFNPAAPGAQLPPLAASRPEAPLTPGPAAAAPSPPAVPAAHVAPTSPPPAADPAVAWAAAAAAAATGDEITGEPEMPAADRRPAPPPAEADAARTDEIGGSALRRTVVEPAARRLRPKPGDRPEGRDSRDEIALPPPAAEPQPERQRASSEPSVRFVARLLLPEGDKRLVEIGDQAVKVGSGLDEIGLSGDPRVRPSEAMLEVVDGVLWIEVAEGSTGVYRRVEGEEALADGDVVLIGDIAALFQSLPAAPALAPERQVLGGAASSACGRLVFLRRDGSPGPIHDLPQGKTILGRTDGHINFPSDSRLSRRHARFFAGDARVTVEDLDSRNGTYVRLRGRRRLAVGDALRVGSAGLQIRMQG